MSETDDTDLLLLIPPEFFLVHSPDLGFDSDCDINHSIVKDSIVSDLITQVNDLESRICMIENSEKSATICSTFNDDSYANNSLTESDILRFKESEHIGLLANESPKLNNSQETLPPNSNTHHLSLNQLKDKSSNGQVTIYETSVADRDLNLEKKADLLTEIDNFLGIDGNNKAVIKYFTNNAKHKEITSPHTTDNIHLYVDGGMIPSPTSKSLEYNTGNSNTRSLALPEVHQLLKEMEETQKEIERKLMLRSSHISSHDKPVTSKHSESLGFDDSSTNYFTSLARKQPDNILDRKPQLVGMNSEVIHSTNNVDSPLSYFLTSELNDKNEGLLRSNSKMKPISPNRSKIDSSPLDIVKPDNLAKEKTTVSQFSCDNSSLSRNSNFRRHLNFERASLSPKASRSRPSLQFDSITKSRLSSDSPHMLETSEKLPTEPLLKSNLGVRTITEDKTIHPLSVRTNTNRMNATSNTLEQKTSSNAILQQRLSSNNLLSLSELWNNEPTFYSDDPNKLRQKLEEEKYRRQHCEQQIQALQLRVLEEREKLAVAVKVDQEKDKAISQITESWKRLNDHWREIEEQRHSLAQQLHEEKESSKIRNNDLMKKAEKWEKEVSQALDLALGYKEKSESTQLQMNALKHETENKLEVADSKINKLSEENQKLIIENKSQLEQLSCFHDRIEEEEKLLSKLKVELEKSKKQLNDYEAEVNILKEQKETLTVKVQEEKNRISVLEKQKKELEGALAESVKREKTAQEAARLSTERIDVARTELRALYQGQLETVVKEKLQEFQNQLDAAETALTDELNTKEKQWIEKSNYQQRQLQEKYTVDLCQIEGTYKREIEKWKKKVIECEKLRGLSEDRLQEEKNRRVEIAHKLHSVMENQWREALNIISNPTQSMHASIKDETNERLLSNHETTDRIKGGGDLKASRSNSGTSLLQCEDAPFCREDLVTSRLLKSSQDPQLKKYIEMLLERGSQHDTVHENNDHTFSTEASFMNNKWMLFQKMPPGALSTIAGKN